MPIFSVATPFAPTGAVPTLRGPMLNVTVPVGCPAPGATGRTVALQLCWSAVSDVVVVAALPTVTVTEPVLAATWPVPEKPAVIVWDPTARLLSGPSVTVPAAPTATGEPAAVPSTDHWTVPPV